MADFSSLAAQELFSPLAAGALTLSNRIVMAPLTRCRAGQTRVPNELMADYYSQRSSAGLILTEATAISPMGIGYLDTPGIWSAEQVRGWRTVTKRVHDAGGLIVLQLWHAGRMSHPSLLDGRLPEAPSAIAAKGQLPLRSDLVPLLTPRALTTSEISGILEDFHVAARNAMDAGFDGVELHAANGYLPDQFLQDGSNQRADHYGGSIENRARFTCEILDVLISVWGAQRVGLHLSPRCDTHSMGDSNPLALFSYVATEAERRKLAFLCVREFLGPDSIGEKLRKLFSCGAYIANEGFAAESACAIIRKRAADAVAFGVNFLANPDLPQRILRGLPLNQADRATFYTPGPVGYVDYPSLEECIQSGKR